MYQCKAVAWAEAEPTSSPQASVLPRRGLEKLSLACGFQAKLSQHITNEGVGKGQVDVGRVFTHPYLESGQVVVCNKLITMQNNLLNSLVVYHFYHFCIGMWDSLVPSCSVFFHVLMKMR